LLLLALYFHVITEGALLLLHYGLVGYIIHGLVKHPLKLLLEVELSESSMVDCLLLHHTCECRHGWSVE